MIFYRSSFSYVHVYVAHASFKNAVGWPDIGFWVLRLNKHTPTHTQCWMTYTQRVSEDSLNIYFMWFVDALS